MDDLRYGTRNKRGDCTPNTPLEGAPQFRWPVQPRKLISWLPHYFLPRNWRGNQTCRL